MICGYAKISTRYQKKEGNSLEAGDTLMITKLVRPARSAAKGIELIDELLSWYKSSRVKYGAYG